MLCLLQALMSDCKLTAHNADSLMDLLLDVEEDGRGSEGGRKEGPWQFFHAIERQLAGGPQEYKY